MRALKLLGLGLALVVVAIGVGNSGQMGLAQQAQTATVYVDDTKGNDARCARGSNTAPCKTIQQGIIIAQAGDTVQVSSGTYSENVTICPTSGPCNTPLTLEGADSTPSSINGSIAIGPRAGISITIKMFKIQGSNGNGLSIDTSTGSVTVQQVYINGSAGAGVFITDGSTVTLSNNRINSNTGNGIGILQSSTVTMNGNKIRDNSGCGIIADSDSVITGSATPQEIQDNKGGNLCGKAVVLDKNPPDAPLYLVYPFESTGNKLTIAWVTLPDQALTKIVAAWYKVGTVPVSSEDGTRVADPDKHCSVVKEVFEGWIQQLPNSIRQTAQEVSDVPSGGSVHCLTLQSQGEEGELPVYLWLEDEAGNKEAPSKIIRCETSWLQCIHRASPSLEIDDGAEATTSPTATLQIQSASIEAQMRFSNSNDGQHWSPWKSFSSTHPNWNLFSASFGGSSGLGPKTVYAQLQDLAGNVSQVFSATIKLIVTTLPGTTRNSIYSLAFSPDSKLLAFSASDNTIKIWRVNEGEEVQPPLSLSSGYQASTLAFSRDGNLLAAGSYGGVIQLWEVATVQEIQSSSRVLLTFSDGDQYSITSLAFSPDSRVLAASHSDNVSNLSNLWVIPTDGKPAQQKIPSCDGTNAQVTALAFSLTSNLLAIGCSDGKIRLSKWEEAAGQPGGGIQTLSSEASRPITSLAFSPDGKLLAAGTGDPTIQIWEVATVQEIQSPSPVLLTITDTDQHSITSLAFSPDSKVLAAGHSDNVSNLWKVATGHEIPLSNDSEQLNSIAFSPDGQLLAAGYYDGKIELWDLSALTGK